MSVFLIILVLIATFLVMEFVAFFVHKYVMHTFLWGLHKDHHQPTDHHLQKNDFFFLIFAIPSWLGIMLGLMYALPIFVTIGAGIALYGVCYVLVHEIFIHQRLRFFKKTNSAYLKGIRKAHKVHHKNMGKEHGTCFGMLIVPKKYFK
ncbi:carotene hydroxylase [Putridiphycobacter roseus]|uniref:Carotene hydroxylase n=1 Tax=Putridiphycobacter roseus TaxID=2219161 RepID=A0A2W1MYV4_9FLAO|nr:sterol desaturase family protein [Putridiphycobacter roseus]PZE17067.1 carotene hydroxylase [Putridiphycobacter roseus]